MTDLSKGMIEIAGYTIDANTTSDDILENLKDVYAFYDADADGSSALFRFDPVDLYGQSFKVKAFFFNKRLRRLELFSHCGDHLSFEELFTADCEWLKSVLGEPTEAGSNGVLYDFGDVKVDATYLEDDGRSGPDEYITIRY